MDPVARARSVAAALTRLADLLEKYRLLDRLSRGEPGRTVERRDAMRAIADRFPAAMREWDEAPAAELGRRRGEIERVLDLILADLDGGRGLAALAAPERAWIRWSGELHERLRALLAVKRWLAGREVSDGIAAEAARRFGIDRARLEAIAAPPGGRVAAIAYAETAAAHEVTVDEIKAFLFPKEDEP